MTHPLLDIADVARRAGVTPAALRYYEDIGLIRSAGRHGLRRQFEHSVLDQLDFIRLAKLAGFSLKDLTAMVQNGGFRVDRSLIGQKAEQIERQIQYLTATLDLLNHVRNCPEEEPLDCPRFKKLMRVARSFLAAPDQP